MIKQSNSLYYAVVESFPGFNLNSDRRPLLNWDEKKFKNEMKTLQKKFERRKKIATSFNRF